DDLRDGRSSVGQPPHPGGAVKEPGWGPEFHFNPRTRARPVAQSGHSHPVQSQERFMCSRPVVGLVVLLIALPARAADPRPIEIQVDLTDAPRKLFKAHLVIPAEPGKLTLYYPKWIPGEHQPSGPIIDLSGLKFRAGGKPIRWTRDDVDLYAFHLTV